MDNLLKYFLTTRILLLILIFSLSVFVVHTFVIKNAVFADGEFYFAYVRSWVLDRDVNLVNDFKLLDIKPAVNWQGLAVNTFPPGSSILWFIPYLLLDKIVTLFHPQRIGLELIYQLVIGFDNIFLGVFGLYLIYLTLIKYFDKKIGLVSVLILFATTNLLFYIAVEPINSHAVSFFISSLIFYYLFAKLKKLTHTDSFILGLLSGFAGAVRPQDALIAIFPILKLFLDHKSKSKMLPTYFLLFTTGFLIGFLPQIYLWKIFFNFYFPPPGWGYGFSFFAPQILYVLFNKHNGLFVFTPTILVGFVGLLLFWKKQKSISFIGILYFLLQVYLIASWRDYYQGGSFSIRMLISTYPAISFGFAYLIEKTLKKYNSKIIVASIFTLACINSLLITRYLLMY